MANLFSKAFKLITGDEYISKRPFKSMSERELIQLESEIGAELFGPIPADHRREFFCLDVKSWIWYEEWIDAESGKKKSLTTRYEVHPKGILKAQDGANYTFIEGDELRNLAVATRLYNERVLREVYKKDPNTGQSLTSAPVILNSVS